MSTATNANMVSAMSIDSRVDGDRCALPGRARGLHRAVPRGGPDAADAAAAAVRRGRLQRAAPGPVRRTCLSAPGGDFAVGAGERLYRRRVRADRATAADAVAG